MFSKTMEFCNKGMIWTDPPPPPRYGQRPYFDHFFGTLPLEDYNMKRKKYAYIQQKYLGQLTTMPNFRFLNLILVDLIRSPSW